MMEYCKSLSVADRDEDILVSQDLLADRPIKQKGKIPDQIGSLILIIGGLIVLVSCGYWESNPMTAIMLIIFGIMQIYVGWKISPEPRHDPAATNEANQTRIIHEPIYYANILESLRNQKWIDFTGNLKGTSAELWDEYCLQTRKWRGEKQELRLFRGKAHWCSKHDGIYIMEMLQEAERNSIAIQIPGRYRFEDSEIFFYFYAGRFYFSDRNIGSPDIPILVDETHFRRGKKLLEQIDHARSRQELRNRPDMARERISDIVQTYVWDRDEGKCVKCGSKKHLEFDHVIPHSKGGGNSARNLQLLCQRCNREKSAKIGG